MDRAGRFPLADSEFAEFLEISVTDSGIGISPDGLERLFKPFSQIDSGLARKIRGHRAGAGHGQAPRRAARRRGGRGERRGRGLPLHGLAAASGRGAAAVALSEPPAPIDVHVGIRRHASLDACGPATALVVEDDFKSAELIRVQLEAEGFRVLHAASAEAALALAVQQPLSLITLDIMLPDMDGWEFLGRIKQVPALARIPVVIISIVADHNKGFALGAAAIMQKPISRQELYESLVELGLFPLAQRPVAQGPGGRRRPQGGGADRRPSPRHGQHGAARVRRPARRSRWRARELPDLIVLDLMMPDVNGFDVVEALTKHPDTARIPILVVTAKQITAEDRAKLNGYGDRRSWKRPRSTPSASPPKSGAPCRAARRQPDMARVLIVEDNPANMTLATFLLQSAGHTVLSATRRRGRADAGARRAART